MVRASFLTVGWWAIAACGPASSGSSSRAVYPLGDEPVPPASERCFRDRLTVEGGVVAGDFTVRLAVDPPASRLAVVLRERSARDALWSLALSIDGARFTALERGPDGDAQGAGTLVGPRWQWHHWSGAVHHADGIDETLEIVVDDRTHSFSIAREKHRADGTLVSSDPAWRFAEVACATLGDDPIETLYPKP
jgi:hypothetical protein